MTTNKKTRPDDTTTAAAAAADPKHEPDANGADPIGEPAASEADQPEQINLFSGNVSGQELAQILKRGEKRKLTKQEAATIAESLQQSIEKIAARFDDVRTATRVIAEGLQYIIDNEENITKIIDELEELQPYIDKELQDPKYGGITFDDLMGKYTLGDVLDLPDGDPLADVIRRARAKKLEWEALHKVNYSKATTIEASSDKLPVTFFDVLAPKPTGNIPGQIGMGVIPSFEPPTVDEMNAIAYNNGSKKDITLFYDYSFKADILEMLGLLPQFDDEDFFIITILDNLRLNGNNEVSINKLFSEVYGREPNARDKAKFFGRLVRGATTTIIINDIQVLNAWNVDTDTFSETISQVFPIQITNERFRSNGVIAKQTVNINSLSPFMILSKKITHVTTWDKEVLTNYKGRRTPRYFAVLRYLMQQIRWMRAPNSDRSNKITYSDLYEKTKAHSRKEKEATKKMFFRILDEVFIELDYIKSYKEDKRGEPGVSIRYTPKGKRNKVKKQLPND